MFVLFLWKLTSNFKNQTVTCKLLIKQIGACQHLFYKKKMSKSSRELTDLFSQLKSNLDSDKRYWVRNDAKLRAVVTSRSYDEFREIVDAAHLKSLSKDDCKKKAKIKWNKATI